MNATWIVVALLFGCVVGWLIKPCEDTGVTTSASTIEVKIDTVDKIIYRDRVSVRGKGTIINHISRVSQSLNSPSRLQQSDCYDSAFTSVLDTIVNRDTIHIEYEHPINLFTLMMRPAPDSIRYETMTTTLTNTKTIYEQRAWWIDALTHIGAVAIGYGVGSGIK